MSIIGRISLRLIWRREKPVSRSFLRKCSRYTRSSAQWLMLVASPMWKVSPWITKTMTRSSTISEMVIVREAMSSSFRSLSMAIYAFRTRAAFMAGRPMAMPSRYPRALSIRSAAAPVAPRRVHIGVAKANTMTISRTDSPIPTIMERVKTPLAPSRSPLPIIMVKRLRAPAATMAPKSEKMMTMGLTRPKAAMESVPRHWPITTPSIRAPMWVVRAEMI